MSEPNWTFLHELSQSDAVFFTNGAKEKHKEGRKTSVISIQCVLNGCWLVFTMLTLVLRLFLL